MRILICAVMVCLLAGCVPEPPKPTTTPVPPHARYTIVSRFSDGIAFEKFGGLYVKNPRLMAPDGVDYAGPWQKAIVDFLGTNYDGTYVPLDFKFASYPTVRNPNVLGQIFSDEDLSSGDIAQLSQAISGRNLDFVIVITEGSATAFDLHSASYGHGLHQSVTVVKDFPFAYAIYTISVYDVRDWSRRLYVGMSRKNAAPFTSPGDFASITPEIVEQAQSEVATLWPPADTDFALCFFGFARNVQVLDDHTRAYTCNQIYPVNRPEHFAGPLNIASYWLLHPMPGHADLHQ
jgi:hypothetical protein